jgi:hypothetical protein
LYMACGQTTERTKSHPLIGLFILISNPLEAAHENAQRQFDNFLSR